MHETSVSNNYLWNDGSGVCTQQFKLTSSCFCFFPSFLHGSLVGCFKVVFEKGYLHWQVYLDEDISYSKCINNFGFLWYHQNEPQCWKVTHFFGSIWRKEAKTLLDSFWTDTLRDAIRKTIGTFKINICFTLLDEAHLSPSPANWLTFNLINKPESWANEKNKTKNDPFFFDSFHTWNPLLAVNLTH